jgi:hypothetical protein
MLEPQKKGVPRRVRDKKVKTRINKFSGISPLNVKWKDGEIKS